MLTSLGSTKSRPKMNPLTSAALEWLKLTYVRLDGHAGRKKQLQYVGRKDTITIGLTFRSSVTGTMTVIVVFREPISPEAKNRIRLHAYGRRAIMELRNAPRIFTRSVKQALVTYVILQMEIRVITFVWNIRSPFILPVPAP